MMDGLRFEVLGPVRGWRGDTEVDLGSPQQRAVLAMLLLARGRLVTLDTLIAGLWGDELPRSASATIRTYISRLRRQVDLIQSAGDGYFLSPRPDRLDLDEFEEGLGEAHQAQQRQETVRAAVLLRDALGLWHGAALAGLPGPYAGARRVRLTELQLAAVEDKLAMDVALGEHGLAIAGLRALRAAHPFRERLSELLMLALCQSGRQAEALEVFDGVRRQLRAELGIDPGPALQAMHQQVLRSSIRRLPAVDLQLVG
jgi:DNA-binding SARP family transcriptional activator